MSSIDGICGLIAPKSTEYGRTSQPHTVEAYPYRMRMKNSTSKSILWANVESHLDKRYGRANVTKFAADSGITVGTLGRVKKASTSIGLDIVDELAAALDVESWQLLVPGASADQLPALGGEQSAWPLVLISRERFMRLSERSRNVIEGYLLRTVEELEAQESRRQA